MLEWITNEKSPLSYTYILQSLHSFSCSDSSNTQVTQDSSSLKSIADQKFKQIEWTQALEGNRLTAGISSINTVEKRIQLSPTVVINSSYASSLPPVFPYLEGFGSLDISNFNSSVKTLAVKFSSAMCNGEIDSSLFEKDNIFEAALFENDLKTYGKLNFQKIFQKTKKAKIRRKLNQQYKKFLFFLMNIYLANLLKWIHFTKFQSALSAKKVEVLM